MFEVEERKPDWFDVVFKDPKDYKDQGKIAVGDWFTKIQADACCDALNKGMTTPEDYPG